MEVPHIGKVTEDPRFHSLVSEPIAIPFLRQHMCRFVLNGYAEDPNLDEYHRAIKNVLSISDSVLVDAQEYVFEYYQDMATLLAEAGWEAPPKIRRIPDVWKHVRLGSDLYVERLTESNDEDGIYISLECGCDWEQEHGMQVVLRNGLLITKVGPFDGHLTNARAFADPSLKGIVYKRIS